MRVLTSFHVIVTTLLRKT